LLALHRVKENHYFFSPQKEESQTGNRILGADATQHLHPAVIALGDPAKDPHDNISQFCVSKKDHHSVSSLPSTPSILLAAQLQVPILFSSLSKKTIINFNREDVVSDATPISK